MKSLKSRIVTSLGAAALALSVSTAAHASWLDPVLGDVEFALDHITAELTQLTVMGIVKATNVKVVYLEDILTGDQLADVKADLQNFDTQLEIITLKNTLNNLKVLEGANITALKDFLNGNDIDINDAVALEVFRDGRVIIFGCGDGC